MNDPVKLVTTKPDSELAEELKTELAESAKAWLDACTRANKAGFQVQATFGPDFFGRQSIHTLNLVKIY